MPDQPQPPALYFEPLGDQHDRAGFSCGVEALDEYLHRQARQDLKKRVAAVFVLTSDGKTVAGYYTLSQYSVELGALPDETARKLPKYPQVPATLIGRLARSLAFREQGVGELLLMDALERSVGTSTQAASFAVIVDAKDDKAANFYRTYGFIDLPKTPGRLFLPMTTVQQLFEGLADAGAHRVATVSTQRSPQAL